MRKLRKAVDRGCGREAAYGASAIDTHGSRGRESIYVWTLDNVMSAPTTKSFTALLEPDGTLLRWVVARIPFDVAKAWPERRRLRVCGEIEGFAFRTSLFPDPRGKGHILLVNKKMQTGAKAAAGERVRIRLEPDLEERTVATPPELERALKGDRRLPRWFAKLSDSMRHEIGKWVD